MNNLIGIIGAGTMGISVALDLIYHQIPMILVDLSEQILEKAREEIIKNARFANLLDGKLRAVSTKQIDEYLRMTTDIYQLDKCTFIIENINENIEVKSKLYKSLNNVLNSNICIGANTSCISITRLASNLNYPENLVGMHLMNPVYIKKTVEIIRGYHTSDKCIQKTEELLKQLDKKAIVVNDYPGFVTNRISHIFMNEAVYVVQDQVATVQQVDAIFRDCYSHKMGPLETADLIGLDTVVDSLNILYQYYQDTKFRCCPLLKKMVDAGLLGKKSGRGFYVY